MIDICIPVYLNTKCFEIALQGLTKNLAEPDDVHLYLHAQEERDAKECVRLAKRHRFDHTLIPSVKTATSSMADIMNALFNACKSPWVVMMEQDTFIYKEIDLIALNLEDDGYIAAGVVDTMHFSNSNAREMPLYGKYSRLSPEPGYFHSSLMLLKRDVVAAASKTPFTIPEGFKMHGYGVLGGELYYGLRMHIGSDPKRLAFFEQIHTDYGYGAAIVHDGTLIARHLYFSSSRKDRRYIGGLLTEPEHDWLAKEEDRFLADYLEEIYEPKS